MIVGLSITQISVTNALEFETAIFIAVSPDPIGVNQQVSVTSIIANVPPPQFPEDRPRYGYWNDLTLTINKPDATTETRTGLSTAEAGTGYYLYTPTMVGEYKFQYSFPGQTIEVGPDAGDYYKPSVSPVISLTVQEDPIEYLPEVPLPTDYWTTPIYGENRDWVKIAGNWLGMEDYEPSGDGYNPYTLAPNSAHILWKNQEMFGGIIQTGDSLNPYTGYTGRRPDEKFQPIIIGGRLYMNAPVFYGIYGGSTTRNGFKCVDLFTGEEIWSNIPSEEKYITMGQVVHHQSTAQEGIFPYLWETSGSGWTMYDAWTGEWVLDIEGVQGGTNIFGPQGEILRYSLDSRNNKLTMWNSSKLLLTGMRVIGVAIDWAPSKGVYNYTEGIQWTVDVQDVAGNPSIAYLSDDILLASVEFGFTEDQPYVIRQDCAYSLKPEDKGRLLWVKNHTMFDDQDGINSFSDGVYISFARDKLQWFGYDANTGADKWAAEPFDTAFSMYSGRDDNTVIAEGVIYNCGYDGMVRALDLETGELIWSWFTGSGGLDSPYGGWALHGGYTGPRFADGKVFVINQEHTPLSTPWKGGKVYAIDGETGEEVWRISGTQAEACPAAVAYGVFVYLNGYDSCVYAFGKGPSKTTVTAPKVEIVQGQTIVIEGTVTDQSAGQPDTPCISDEDMTAWMEYLHMQQLIPADAKGVEVSLDVIDANGNFRNIGTAISDISGVFSYAWEPDIPGQYTLIATFAGSESYGSSFAQTSFYVEGSPTPTPPLEATPAPPTDTYVMGFGIAILAAVIIIGVVLIMMMRKK